jgi:hypothetical protein
MRAARITQKNIKFARLAMLAKAKCRALSKFALSTRLIKIKFVR